MQVLEFIWAIHMKDFIKHFKLQDLVTNEVLLDITKKHVANNNYGDAAKMIDAY